jgi:hypothetical protein
VRVAGLGSDVGPESTGPSKNSDLSRVGVKCGLRVAAIGATGGSSSEAACAVALGVTSSLGGMMLGDGSGKAPGIWSMAGVNTGGRPCGIAVNGVVWGISIL